MYSSAVCIAQIVAHAVGESILCCEGWHCGSSQMTLWRTYYCYVLSVMLAVVGICQEMIARYVSLIPCLSDSVVFPGLCDIWSSCSVSLSSHLFVMLCCSVSVICRRFAASNYQYVLDQQWLLLFLWSCSNSFRCCREMRKSMLYC